MCVCALRVCCAPAIFPATAAAAAAHVVRVRMEEDGEEENEVDHPIVMLM